MAFDLSAILKPVSSLDTSREQIEYVAADHIRSDERNFYELSDIPALAENISMCGLQQPIRLRPDPNADGKYIIVSGHRRMAAIRLLAADDPERWNEVACIVERDETSPALQQLRLIYANANTRKMSSAELGEQAAQINDLLCQLKEDGYEFPGRMRDHVAEVMGVKATKLARLKVIRDGLNVYWSDMYRKGDLNETCAYEIAQMDAWTQSMVYEQFVRAPHPGLMRSNLLSEIRVAASQKLPKCKVNGDNCVHKYERVIRYAISLRDFQGRTLCNRCCAECDDLMSCKYSCTYLQEEKKVKRAERREEAAALKAEQEQRDQPYVDYITGVYARILEARKAAGKTAADVMRAARHCYIKAADYDKFEHGENIKAGTCLPFGGNFNEWHARDLVQVADLLGVSTDYLLGRTEEMQPTQPAPAAGFVWHSVEEQPKAFGNYIGLFETEFSSELSPKSILWNEDEWLFFGAPLSETAVKLVFWTESPEVWA